MTAQTLPIDSMVFRVPAAATWRRTEAQPGRRTARLAGVFYLLVGVFGGFAVGFVEPRMYAAGDAALTMQTILSNTGLLRFGVVADLLNQAFFVALAVTLYALLKDVHRGAARAMVALVIAAAAIASLNAVFLFEALQVATGSTYLSAFGENGVAALVLLLADLQHYGMLAAQLFFGLWLAPLGYLAFKSGRFPKPLGGVLVLAAACYLIDLLAAFLAPDLGRTMHGVVVVPCAVAEIWMVAYLLVIGVRAPTSSPSDAAEEPSTDDLCG